MIRSQHENRKPFAPNSLKIPTRQHRCNKAAQGAAAEIVAMGTIGNALLREEVQRTQAR
jgi:hypothetical protein